MGRDISFFHWANMQTLKKMREEQNSAADCDDFYDKHVFIAGAALGSGDAWPCYIRFFFIAAYRRAATANSTSLPVSKDVLLAAILAVCPPDCNQIKPVNERSQCLDEVAMADERNQILLDVAGVSVLVDLVRHHRMERFGGTNKLYREYWHPSLIQRAAHCFAELKAFCEPIANDPYDSTLIHNDIPHSLNDVVDAFSDAELYPTAVGFVE